MRKIIIAVLVLSFFALACEIDTTEENIDNKKNITQEESEIKKTFVSYVIHTKNDLIVDVTYSMNNVIKEMKGFTIPKKISFFEEFENETFNLSMVMKSKKCVYSKIIIEITVNEVTTVLTKKINKRTPLEITTNETGTYVY